MESRAISQALDGHGLDLEPAQIFDLPRSRLFVAATLVVTCAVLAGLATFWLGTHHPDYSSPRGIRAQAQIVRVFGEPSSSDSKLIGDYAVERFYAINPGDGRIYVADLCKGRVKRLLESSRPDGTLNYSLMLDRSDIRPELISNLVSKDLKTRTDEVYLGLKVQGGSSEVFPLNYTGTLPQERATFRTWSGDDLDTYLKSIPKGAQLKSTNTVNVKGSNYLLSSTDVYPYFSTLFGMNRAILLSHLVFVDDQSIQAQSR